MFLAALLLVLPLATCRQLAHDEKYLKELERLAALRLEISCYALPYGGLGFTSHMLTYYTIGALAYGCQPLRPWKPLEGKWWDRPLAIVQVVGTVTFSAITMARCHQRWEFVLVALWMMTTAITLSVITIVGPLAPDRWKNPFTILVTWKAREIHNPPEPTWQEEIRHRPKLLRRYYYVGVFLWVTGSITGLVGTLAIIIPVFDIANGFSITFGVLFIPTAGTFLFMSYGLMAVIRGGVRLLTSPRQAVADIWGAVVLTLKAFLFFLAVGAFFFGLLYMDWILGGVAGNLVGVPSRANSAIFWTYFALKRLGLLAA